MTLREEHPGQRESKCKVPELGACLASLMDSKEARAGLRERVEGSEERILET